MCTCRSLDRWLQTCAGETICSAVGKSLMAMITASFRMDKRVASSIIAAPSEKHDAALGSVRSHRRADRVLPGQALEVSQRQGYLVWTHNWSNWPQWLHDSHRGAECSDRDQHLDE